VAEVSGGRMPLMVALPVLARHRCIMRHLWRREVTPY